MKKILLSLATLAFVGAVIVGGTIAIFSDTEVSTGNTFTAGAIDLTVDNESYYNGVFNEGTSWLQPANLDDGQGPGFEGEYWFFHFEDLKPGDWGEDTISLHVNNNDSWLCVDVTLTSNQDNGSTEPELNDEEPWTAGRGELADNVNFIWWADDGDNVLEDDEHLLPSGPLGNLGVDETATTPLADSNTNIWLGSGPVVGGETYYIGKAWCFGDFDIEASTYNQDGLGAGENNGPDVRQIDCDGSGEDNETQTDSMTADISFRAEQSRNNEEFECVAPPQPEVATLTVDKRITFTDVLVDVEISDFDLHVLGPSAFHEHFTDEIPWSDLEPGLYTVSETYEGLESIISIPVFGLDCNSSGEVTLVAGDNKTCQVTNEVEPAP